MNAIIMCDASFDLNYGLSGYAGVVSIKNKKIKENYQGSFAGLKSSNEAELNAIYEGLKLIVKHTTKDKPITSVNIFSDSQNSIDRLKNKNKNLKKSRLEHFLLKQIREIYDDLGIKVFYHHVKAHQKDSKATVLEKRHNAIDKQAYRVLKEKRKTIDNASQRSKSSSKYGVIVDSEPSKRMNVAYNKLGYELASSGLSARVVMQGKRKNLTEHPFYLGVKEYAMKAGLNTCDLITQVHWKNEVVPGFTDRMFGCQGMDSCLLKSHKKTTGIRISEKNSEANRSGATSRLIFGYQSKIQKSEVAKSDYNDKPARFILDLSMSKKENMSVSYWAKEFCKKLDISLLNNLKDLQNDKKINVLNNGLPENNRVDDCSLAS
jgi:ribonuclease HI